ncbi:TRAP transporter small permease [Sedimentitalea sp.]|uniref:TRAP transporter small permease n=1 Tax=Sedimentitalea sp. TaxID=2048915 RepID=UPI003296A6CE
MRNALDLLYRASGGIAATFLALIAVTILAQVGGRVIGVTVDSTESGGFCLAGTTFMGMAYTFKSGGHIRVTLLLARLGPSMARILDILVCGFAAFGCTFLTWEVLGMTHDSWRFGELSPGLLAIPVWIPQCFMLGGMAILAIALIDDFILLLRGRLPGFDAPQEAALDATELTE